jgi:hypothetical protein
VSGHIIENWRLLAQSVSALADHLNNAVGYQLTPVTFANLPSSPKTGMVVWVSDSTVNTWGTAIAGGGTFTVLASYNGTAWTVVGK